MYVLFEIGKMSKAKKNFVLKGQRDHGQTVLAYTFRTTTDTTDTAKMQ